MLEMDKQKLALEMQKSLDFSQKRFEHFDAKRDAVSLPYDENDWVRYTRKLEFYGGRKEAILELAKTLDINLIY